MHQWFPAQFFWPLNSLCFSTSNTDTQSSLPLIITVFTQPLPIFQLTAQWGCQNILQCYFLCHFYCLFACNLNILKQWTLKIKKWKVLILAITCLPNMLTTVEAQIETTGQDKRSKHWVLNSPSLYTYSTVKEKNMIFRYIEWWKCVIKNCT